MNETAHDRRRPVTSACLLAVMLTGTAGLVWYWGLRGPAEHAEAPGKLPAATPLSPAAGPETGAFLQTTEPQSTQEATSSPARTLTAVPVGDLEALLEKPGFAIRQRDVPPLDPATEDALIARYQKGGSIKARFSIMRILAFGGSDRSIPLMTNALLREFGGQQVTSEENGMLLDIPICLGILGHREPLAVDFLWQAKEPGVIQAESLWRCEDGYPTVAVMQGRCIQGLGFSGRADIRPYFDHWWSHPEEVAARESDYMAIPSALFYLWAIDRYGWDKAIDDVLGDLQRRMGQFRAWRATPEGQAWCVEWRKKVDALRSAQRPAGSPVQ